MRVDTPTKERVGCSRSAVSPTARRGRDHKGVSNKQSDRCGGRKPRRDVSLAAAAAAGEKWPLPAEGCGKAGGIKYC